MRLLNKVRNMDEELATDALASRWSLGKNGVVRTARTPVEKLLGGMDGCPGARQQGQRPRIFQTTLSTRPGLRMEYANFGYLTWEEFEAHCRTNAAEWPETLANFEFNRGQIFGLHEAAEPPPPRTAVT